MSLFVHVMRLSFLSSLLVFSFSIFATNNSNKIVQGIDSLVDLDQKSVLELQNYAQLQELAEQLKLKATEIQKNQNNEKLVIRMIHVRGKNPSARLKALIELLYQQDVEVHFELVDRQSFLEASYQIEEKLLEVSFALHESTPSFLKALEDIRYSITDFFGLSNGITFMQHFVVRVDEDDVDAEREAEDAHQDKIESLLSEDGWGEVSLRQNEGELQQPANKKTKYKARFEIDWLNSLNALSVASVGTAISYIIASTSKAFKGRPFAPRLVISHIFVFAWVWTIVQFQRELGSFRLQGADWQVNPDAKPNENALQRKNNKAFLFGSGIIQETILLSTMFYVFRVPGGVPMWKTMSMAIISAVSFIPIEKIKGLIFLNAEAERLAGNEENYNKLNKRANLIGFIYWNFIFAVLKNISLFGAKVPFKDFFKPVLNQDSSIRGTTGLLKFWDVPILALGLGAVGIDLYDERHNLSHFYSNWFKNTFDKSGEQGDPTAILFLDAPPFTLDEN